MLFGAWEVLCFSDNVQLLEHATRRFPTYTWPATWQMFTLKATSQESLRFEGRYDDVWVRLPMEEWLPARWESGYRWEATVSAKHRLRPFLAWACERSGSDRVRLVRHVWARRLGDAAQFERGARESVVGEAACP